MLISIIGSKETAMKTMYLENNRLSALLEQIAECLSKGQYDEAQKLQEEFKKVLDTYVSSHSGFGFSKEFL